VPVGTEDGLVVGAVCAPAGVWLGDGVGDTLGIAVGASSAPALAAPVEVPSSNMTPRGVLGGVVQRSMAVLPSKVWARVRTTVT
jgi:hypothetical protein